MRKSRPCILEDRHGSMFGAYCVMCKKKIGLTYKEKLDAQVEEVPQHKKQTLINYLHKGKTIGEAKELAGIEDTAVACEIITRSIGTISYLKREAV